MTALNEFDRLEAPALWRPSKDAQRQEVIVAMGKATLTLSDASGSVLAHWSLPALERVNAPTQEVAIYRPAPDSDEELEIDDTLLIDAITRIQKAVEKGRKRPGRLRNLVWGAGILTLVGTGVFWLPDALIRHTVSILPAVTRSEIGEALLTRIERLTGQPCSTVHGQRALVSLKKRLLPEGKIVVLPSGVKDTQHLPGDIILLGRDVIEDFDTPDVVAGYVLAETERMSLNDPVNRLLEEAGLVSAIQLLTTGHLPDAVIDAHAESLLTAPQIEVPHDALIARFAQANLAPSPYAYARDLTGETVLPLIEAEGVQIENPEPVLRDSDWVALQGMCLG